MRKRIYPIYHNGVKIYFTDWTNLNDEDEAVAAIIETTEFVVQNNEKDLLEIIDVRGSYATARIIMILKDEAKKTEPFSKKKAIVGISGSKKIFLNAINRLVNNKIRAFDTLDDAKDWLVG